jgi:hypothetical protein
MTIYRLLGLGLLLVWLAVAAPAARADTEVEALAIATGVIVAAAIATATPTPDEPDQIAFEAGRLDAVKNVQRATAFGVEYRVGRLLVWKLRPFIGAGLTTDHSFYGYGGIRLATEWGERIFVTPSFAVAGYSRGAGKDLGHPPVVGRFGIDFEYACDNDVRIGLAYHHMSNGKLFGQESNPGTEVVGLTLSIALR